MYADRTLKRSRLFPSLEIGADSSDSLSALCLCARDPSANASGNGTFLPGYECFRLSKKLLGINGAQQGYIRHRFGSVDLKYQILTASGDDLR